MKVKIIYAVKLILRAMIACYCLGIYITNPNLLDYTVSKPWIGILIILGIILADILLKFVPLKLHPIGMRKHLKRFFIPSDHYLKKGITDTDRKELKKLKNDGRNVFIFYLILNGIIFILYFSGLIGVPEIIMVMMFYYVGDMICINIMCPFKLIFMRNRCCTGCRIFNWDSIMLVIPLAAVFSYIGYIILLPAIVYTVMWEVSFARHPERFLPSCNDSLKCSNCTHGMCPVKRRKKFTGK